MTRTEFPNDVINTPLDPAAVALLSRLPCADQQRRRRTTTRALRTMSDHENQFDVRVDGALGTSDRAFGRYSYYNQVAQPVSPLPDGSGLISGSVLGSFNYAGLTNVLGQQAVLQRDAYVHAASAERSAAGLHAARQYDGGRFAGAICFGGAGDSRDSVECGVQQCAAAVYVYGLSADWRFGEHASRSIRRACGSWWIR